MMNEKEKAERIDRLKDEYRWLIRLVADYDNDAARNRLQSVRAELTELGVDPNWYIDEG